jgi:hypothetical protein
MKRIEWRSLIGFANRLVKVDHKTAQMTSRSSDQDNGAYHVVAKQEQGDLITCRRRTRSPASIPRRNVDGVRLPIVSRMRDG